MKDFIFIIGPSAVGKSTLARKLFNHYKSVYIEQGMIPEFQTIDGKTDMTGILEEETLWKSMVALLLNFNSMGYKNVLGLDFDDLRTRDIPEVFHGYNYITLKLVCSNYAQNLQQMVNRESGGLIDVDLLSKMSPRILKRKALVNEYTIDIKDKTPDQVMDEAIWLIDNAKTLLTYEYKKPSQEHFYSWVFSNGLR